MLTEDQKSVPEAKNILLFQFFQGIDARCFRHFLNRFQKGNLFDLADKSKYITTFTAVKTGIDLIMKKIQGIGFAVTEWAFTAIVICQGNLDSQKFYILKGQKF